jgi:hypothetical protein
VSVFGYGGGLANYGTATVSDHSSLTDNTAYVGGGIFSFQDSGVEAVLTVRDSDASRNTAFFGGAFYNLAGTVSVSNCTVEGNRATAQGGGIENVDGGTFSVSGGSVSGNTVASGSGGGIFNVGVMTVSDVNLAGNSSTVFGGGIFNFATLTLTGSTFTGNSAGIRGGGVWTSNDFGGFVTGTTTITGNIFSNNTPDAISGIYDGGPNTFL